MNAKLCGLVITIFLISSLSVVANEPPGGNFLKIGLGARQDGLGGAFAGIGDDINTIYWNPGGLGFIRNWELSAMYNRWFADIYHGSFLAAKQFRFLGSRKNTIGIGAVYLGMPEWDNTGEGPISASDMALMFFLGQRLDWLTKRLSVGANVKYIRSSLGEYDATAWAGDAGILLRGLGNFPIGRNISLGVTVQNLGTDLTFINKASPLPFTVRGGVGLRFLQCNNHLLFLATDIRRDRSGNSNYYTGLEYRFKDLLAIRGGYKEVGSDLGDFTFGVGFKWDIFQVDYALANYGKVLGQTHKGALTLHSVGPEPFRLKYPPDLIAFREDSVGFRWEDAPDPDYCDEVSYILIVDRDRDRVEEAITKLKNDPSDTVEVQKDTVLVRSLKGCSYKLSNLKPNDYYWSVIAYDTDRHTRVGSGSGPIRKFTALPPCSASVDTDGTTCVEEIAYTSIEVPLVPIIFFDRLSDHVKEEFYASTKSVVKPVLPTLAKRLKENPRIHITLKGYIDTISEKGADDRLADSRAEAVKDKLIELEPELKVRHNQITISSKHNRKKRRIPRKPSDNSEQRRVNEENRRVEFEVDKAWMENSFFQQQRVPTDSSIGDSSFVPFAIKINSPLDVKNWWLEIRDKRDNLVATLQETLNKTDTVLTAKTKWDGKGSNGRLVPLNDFYFGKLIFKDGLGSACTTKTDSFYIKTCTSIMKEEIFSLAEFDTVIPPYRFYWQKLHEVINSLKIHPDWRVLFVGHACVIGDSAYNDSLSMERALTLRGSLINKLMAADVDTGLVDPADWCGEMKPLEVEGVVIGDNDTPQGRTINRRVMIRLYKPSQKYKPRRCKTE